MPLKILNQRRWFRAYNNTEIIHNRYIGNTHIIHMKYLTSKFFGFLSFIMFFGILYFSSTLYTNQSVINHYYQSINHTSIIPYNKCRGYAFASFNNIATVLYAVI